MFGGLQNGFQNMFGSLGGNRNQNRETRPANNPANDLETFISSILGGAHDSFEAATQAAMRASMEDQRRQPQGPPPASDAALRNLPLITIATEDLVDPCNRECCICLEANELGSTAVRLPCAHIMHSQCLKDWLKRHCTCPVCRFELPTEDASYERTRAERMRNRKPRFARHELERLSNRELKQLLPARSHCHAVDRLDLIDYLIKSGAIDLISSPEPVEYSLSALRSMGVSQLKRCMNDEAGVFFDPKDVVEKEDMIRIFQASGRLCILPEDDENIHTTDDSPDVPTSFQARDSALVGHSPLVETVEDDSDSALVGHSPLVETVEDDSSPEQDLRNDTTIIMEECDPPMEEPNFKSDENENIHPVHGQSQIDRTLQSDDGETQQQEDCETVAMAASDEPLNPPRDDDKPHSQSSTLDEEGTPDEMDTKNTESAGDNSAAQDLGISTLDDKGDQIAVLQEEGEASAAASGVTGVQKNAATQEVSDKMDMSREVSDPMDVSSECDQQIDASSSNRKRSLDSHQHDNPESVYENLSISELRRLARDRSLDLTGCFERNEIVEKLSSADDNTAKKDALLPVLNDYTLSELLMLASIVGMDVTSVRGDREALLSAMELEAHDRPHAASLIKALLPFVRLSSTQLRSVARQRGIDIRGCLEKSDILRNLVIG